MTLHRSSWYQSSKASLYSFHTFPTISPSVQLVPFFTHSPPSFPFPFYSCSLPLPFSPNLLLPCGAEFVDLAGVILGREFRNQMCQSYGRINAYHSPRLLLLFLLLSFPPSTPAPSFSHTLLLLLLPRPSSFCSPHPLFFFLPPSSLPTPILHPLPLLTWRGANRIKWFC